YGVPQHRWRVLIVGIRSDLGVEFAFPDVTHSEDGLLYDQWVSGDYWERHHVPKKDRPIMPPSAKRKVERLAPLWADMLLRPWRTVRDAISALPQLPV